MKESEDWFVGYKRPFPKIGSGLGGFETLCNKIGGEHHSSKDLDRDMGTCYLRPLDVIVHIQENKDGKFTIDAESGLTLSEESESGKFDEVVFKEFPGYEGGIIEGKKNGEVREIVILHNDKHSGPCSVRRFPSGYKGFSTAYTKYPPLEPFEKNRK